MRPRLWTSSTSVTQFSNISGAKHHAAQIGTNRAACMSDASPIPKMPESLHSHLILPQQPADEIFLEGPRSRFEEFLHVAESDARFPARISYSSFRRSVRNRIWLGPNQAG